MESHLLQMRGLKHRASRQSIDIYTSHLLQMRGLKPQGAKKNPCPSRRIFYRCVD